MYVSCMKETVLRILSKTDYYCDTLGGSEVKHTFLFSCTVSLRIIDININFSLSKTRKLNHFVVVVRKIIDSNVDITNTILSPFTL